MHPTGPYRRSFTWNLRAAMGEHDIEPMNEERLRQLVEPIAQLRD